MRKFLVVLLSLMLSLTFVLSGCDDESGGGGTGGKDKLTLKIWIQNVNQPQFFSWAAAEYKKTHPNVTINYIPQNSATLGQTLDSTLAGNSGPDISATWGGLIVPRLIKGETILNLDDVITADIEKDLNESAKINKLDDEKENKWYSVPLSGFASPVIFYNKTFFDANSIEEPTTYSELKAISSKINALGKENIVSGFGDWPMSHFMQAMHGRTMSPETINSLIGVNRTRNPYTKEDGTPIDGLEEGFAMLKQYQDDGIFATNMTGYNASTSQSHFTGGKAVMYAGTSLEYLSISNAPFEIGAFVLPEATAEFAPETKPVSLVNGLMSDVFVVSKKTKYPEESKDFMRFLLSKTAQEKLLEYFLFPVLDAATTDNMPPAHKLAFENVLGDIYSTMKTVGCTPFYQSYSIASTDGRLAEIGQGILNGKMTANAATIDIINFYKNSGIIS